MDEFNFNPVLTESGAEKVGQLMENFNFDEIVDEIVNGMLLDKKVQDGQLVFILPESIGHVKIVKGIPQDVIADLLREELHA